MRRCLGLLLILLTLLPSAAVAHSNSVETSPAQGATLDALPADATLTFTEPPKTAALVLQGPDGGVHKLKARVDGPTVSARLPADGPRGAYTLSYRVVSADGHPVSGSIEFRVTTGVAAPVSDAKPTPTPLPLNPSRGWAFRPVELVGLGLAVLAVAAVALAARSRRR